MKSITRLLTAATLALSGLFAAVGAQAQDCVRISFIRVGTTAADVAVLLQDATGAAIPGAHATLTTSHDLLGSGAGQNCGTVTPNCNRNTGTPISFQLDITGLPTDFSYDHVQVEARGVNIAGNWQESTGRTWKYTIGQYDEINVSGELPEFGSIDGHDLTSTPGSPNAAQIAGSSAVTTTNGRQCLRLTAQRATNGDSGIGCFMALTSIVLYSGETAPAIGEQDDDATAFSVDLSNGTFTSPSTTSNYYGVWTATSTAPGLTLVSDGGSNNNNMSPNDTNINLYYGKSGNGGYTLQTDEGYYVSAYSFEFATDAMTFTPDGGSTVTYSGPPAEKVHAAATGMTAQSAHFTIGGTQGNYVTTEKFYVKVKPAETISVEDGKYYRLRNYERADATRYLTANSALTSAVLDYRASSQLFQFQQAADGTWMLYSPSANAYVGPVPSQNEVAMELVTTTDAAGYFSLDQTTSTETVALVCTNTTNDHPAIHLAGDLRRLVAWEIASGSSQWYIEPVSDDLAAAILALETPYREAKAALQTHTTGEVTIGADYSDLDACIAKPDNMATNAPAPEYEYTHQGSYTLADQFKLLTDGNLSTYFHSTYSGASDPAGYHYVQMKFDEPVTDFILKFTDRHNNHNNKPMHIQLVAPADGEDGTSVSATWSNTFYDADVTYEYSADFAKGTLENSTAIIPVHSATPVQNVRFVVTETAYNSMSSGTGPYWCLSELHVYPAEGNPLNATESTDDALAAQIAAVEAALADGTATADMATSLQDSLDAFLAAYTGEFSITTARYATYYTDKAFIMPAGVKGAYINPVLSQSGEGTTDDPTVYTVQINWDYEAGTVVPAGTPLLVNATDDLTETTTFTVKKTPSEEVAPSPNLLHGQLEAGQTTLNDDPDGSLYWYYALYQTPDGKIGFWWSTNDGKPYELGANKAFLAIKKSDVGEATIQGLTIDPVGDITAITAPTLSTQQQSAAIYTLSGVRVNATTTDGLPAGVYIVGGKKVLVK